MAVHDGLSLPFACWRTGDFVRQGLHIAQNSAAADLQGLRQIVIGRRCALPFSLVQQPFQPVPAPLRFACNCIILRRAQGPLHFDVFILI